VPRYTFECQSCGHAVVESYPMAKVPKRLRLRCECGQPLERIFGMAAIRFRGSGWARHPEREQANRKRGAQ